MNIKSIAIGLVCSIILLLSGCATSGYVWKSEPVMNLVGNDYFAAEISPICTSWGCESFALRITNKTDKNLELNWNKTLYISQGQTRGGFMFEGVVYKDRNNPKSPDIIFSGSNLVKQIWPNNLVYFESGRYGGWRHISMPPGENGVYLTITIDGKEVNEKLSVSLSMEKEKK